MSVFEECVFGIGGVSEMLGGSVDEVASVGQPNNGSAILAHGWFQGNDFGWSWVGFDSECFVVGGK
eukprot:11169874-Lingulodinium_polyedra.AAC.1